MELHELTERQDVALEKIKGGINYRLAIKTLNEVNCQWIEEKATLLSIVPHSLEAARKVLGLTHKSLSEKVAKITNGKNIRTCPDYFERVTKCAKQHFNDHPEDLK